MEESENYRTYSRELAVALSSVSGLFGFLVLLAYYWGVEFAYRPLQNGPATNPLTALCFLLIGYASFASIFTKSPLLQKTPVFAVLTISLIRIIDSYAGTAIHHFFMPFLDFVLLERQSGLQNAMGVNTAFMLFAVSLSLVLLQYKRLFLSQIAGFFALFLVSLSFVGYAYGVREFFGQMSMITTTIGYALSFSVLTQTADQGVLRPMLKKSFCGLLSRYQIFAGLVLPVGLGWLFIRMVENAESQSLFGLYVVTLCWIIFMLTAISAHYHDSIEQKEEAMSKKMEQMAFEDELTRLSNRRKFLEDARREFLRSRRTRTPLWVLMIDVDYFKRINDISGHDVGDRALVEIGQEIRKSVRETDLVGRIGGEEFAVVLTDLHQLEDAALKVAEGLRLRIENLRIAEWTDQHGPVTVSIGITSSEKLGSFEEALKKADISLLNAKNLGRNRVVISDPEPIYC